VSPRPLQHAPVPAPQTKIAPQMPRIPGVPQTAPSHPGLQLKPLVTVITIALLCVFGFAFWIFHSRSAAAKPPLSDETAASQTLTSAPPDADSDPEADAIGTLYELAAPWSSKKFLFVDPNTHQSVPAMVIHLPGSAEKPSFWAFALTNEFSRCELQYVTDLTAISQRFAYPAEHPMVVSDCDGILYDPLKMSTLPDGTWVRGEIVRGGGIRPPIAIQVEVRGRNLTAKRIE
jgi:hypothetical protein